MNEDKAKKVKKSKRSNKDSTGPRVKTWKNQGRLRQKRKGSGIWPEIFKSFTVVSISLLWHSGIVQGFATRGLLFYWNFIPVLLGRCKECEAHEVCTKYYVAIGRDLREAGQSKGWNGDKDGTKMGRLCWAAGLDLGLFVQRRPTNLRLYSEN